MAAFLSYLEAEQLTEMQLGLVFSIRGMPAGTADGQVHGEALRLRVEEVYPPAVLLSPRMLRSPLLHQEILSWLLEHSVVLGVTKDIRRVKRVAEALNLSMEDMVVALSNLDALESRSMRLSQFSDDPSRCRLAFWVRKATCSARIGPSDSS